MADGYWRETGRKQAVSRKTEKHTTHLCKIILKRTVHCYLVGHLECHSERAKRLTPPCSSCAHERQGGGGGWANEGGIGADANQRQCQCHCQCYFFLFPPPSLCSSFWLQMQGILRHGGQSPKRTFLDQTRHAAMHAQAAEATGRHCLCSDTPYPGPPVPLLDGGA